MSSRNRVTLDGNEAAASAAHRLSEVIAIYPITPSSTVPLCGRNGIAVHPEGGRPQFVHLRLCEIQADGMRTEPVERCELTH